MESSSTTPVNGAQEPLEQGGGRSAGQGSSRSWRKTVSALVLSGALAGGGISYGLMQHGPLARAADAAAPSTQPMATHEQIRKAQDLSTVFRTVGKQIEQSVVNINVRKTVKVPRGVPFDDNLLRHFFPNQDFGENGPGDQDNQGQNGQGDQNDQDQGEMEQIGTGSGVIMEVNGDTAYILTNNHVAGGAQEMKITLSDGREITKAKLLGADPKSDLAVVEIHGDHLPAAAKWGNSDDLQQGDWIMAFGSPFGYVGSMTHGIVSALNRTNVGIIPQGYEDFIQVDAPINPGNSGGPLVNLYGEVVGINTAIASRSGGFQGIGFAIPINSARFVYQQLKEHGKVVRGWLGVSIADVSKQEEVAHSMGYTGNTGVLVEEILPNTPAVNKLQHGDVINGLNGKKIDSVLELRNEIAAIAPNTDVTMQIVREGKKQDVTIKLGEQPADLAAAAGRANPDNNSGGEATDNTADALGMRLMSLTDELSQKYNLADVKSGALVMSVSQRSAAYRAGIRAGDVITSVDKHPVNSAKDASDALKKGDVNKGILLYVASRDGSRFVFLRTGMDELQQQP